MILECFFIIPDHSLVLLKIMIKWKISPVDSYVSSWKKKTLTTKVFGEFIYIYSVNHQHYHHHHNHHHHHHYRNHCHHLADIQWSATSVCWFKLGRKLTTLVCHVMHVVKCPGDDHSESNNDDDNYHDHDNDGDTPKCQFKGCK